MSKNLERKLLAEAFEAYVNEGDLAKAQRLFQRHWNLTAKNQFALLEAEDEDFEITNLGDDFNQGITDEIGSESEEAGKNLEAAVEELSMKFPVEMTEDVAIKFDELRNKIDEFKHAEDGEFDVEDFMIVVEDLKADFEANGGLDEEAESLFDEIVVAIQGGEEVEEINVEDEEVEEPTEEIEETDVDVDMISSEDTEEDSDADEEKEEDSDDEEEDEEFDLDDEESIEKLDEIASKLEEDDEEVEGLNEDWSKVKLPRNGLKSEEEGVKKEGMKFKKPINIDGKVGMGVSSTNTQGKSAVVKPKVEKVENKGAKSWTKVAKPANTAKDAKSLLGSKQ
jgi:hypothetical protein